MSEQNINDTAPVAEEHKNIDEVDDVAEKVGDVLGNIMGTLSDGNIIQDMTEKLSKHLDVNDVVEKTYTFENHMERLIDFCMEVSTYGPDNCKNLLSKNNVSIISGACRNFYNYFTKNVENRERVKNNVRQVYLRLENLIIEADPENFEELFRNKYKQPHETIILYGRDGDNKCLLSLSIIYRKSCAISELKMSEECESIERMFDSIFICLLLKVISFVAPSSQIYDKIVNIIEFFEDVLQPLNTDEPLEFVKPTPENIVRDVMKQTSNPEVIKTMFNAVKQAGFDTDGQDVKQYLENFDKEIMTPEFTDTMVKLVGGLGKGINKKDISKATKTVMKQMTKNAK
jgi:hypothetical protein